MAHVDVGTSATKVADVSQPPLQSLLMQNIGSDDVYVSRNSNVSTSGSDGGFILHPDDGLSLEARSDVWAIAASGTQTVAVVVL